MPFHKTLLPAIASFIPIVGPAISPIVSSLLNGGAPAQITPTLLQPFPIGEPIPVPSPVAPKPDPLIWTGVAFIGSDSAQRKLASQLWNTLKISPEDVVLLHNNTTKAQFLIDGQRLLLELTSRAAPIVAAPTLAPPPVMAQAPIQQFQQPALAPTPISFGAAAPVPIIPAALPAVIPLAGAVATTAGRAGLVSVFGKIMGTLGVATGIKAIITWLRTNPATAAGLALTAGLTADQLFDTLAEESIAKNVLLTKQDVKGFRRTLRVGKRFSKFTRARTRTRRVALVPACLPACPPKCPPC